MYEVKWAAIAEQQLAAIWVAAPDQAAVTFAMAWLEAALLRYPLLMGDAMGLCTLNRFPAQEST